MISKTQKKTNKENYIITIKKTKIQSDRYEIRARQNKTKREKLKVREKGERQIYKQQTHLSQLDPPWSDSQSSPSGSCPQTGYSWPPQSPRPRGVSQPPSGSTCTT